MRGATPVAHSLVQQRRVGCFHPLNTTGAENTTLKNNAPKDFFLRRDARKASHRGVALLGRYSLRFQTVVIAMALLLAFGVVAVVTSALLVNSLKNRMVGVAREEMRLLGEEASQQIQMVMEREGASTLGEVANDPVVRAQLRILTADGSVVLAAMVDSDGNCIYQQFGNEQLLEDCPSRKAREVGGRLPANEDLTWNLQVRELPAGIDAERVPISAAGQTVGFIEYGMADSVKLARLDPISRHITTSLSIMAVLVAGFLGLTVFLLYRVANRHIELQRSHDEAQQMAVVGSMASGLAHEIRNPLHAMNLHLEAALDEVNDPREDSYEQVGNVITRVQGQIANLNAILTNFMNYAMPGRIEQEPARLAALVGEVAMTLGPDIDSHGVSVERRIPDDAWVEVDPTAIRQVFTNIILNAVQVMDKVPERKLSISAERQGHHWVLFVDDSGPGIPEGEEARIFEAFVSHRAGGSGFGLSIAKRIIEEHGGTILASTRPEGGARFAMQLPVADPAENPRGAANHRTAGDEPLTIG